MIKRNVCGSDQKQLEIVLEIKSAEWFAEDIIYYSKKLHNAKNGFILE